MPAHPFPHADERQLLLAYIAQQRDAIRYAAFGLTDEQARLAPTASALTVGGLVKHVTETERGWLDLVLQRDRGVPRGPEAYADNFRMAPDDTLAALLADNEAAARETAEAFADIDLDRPVPVPDEPWMPRDVEAWSVRWVLLHLVEELARHAGHADIVRESIDGAACYPLMAAAEGWPATDWLQPWQPPAAEGQPATTA